MHSFNEGFTGGINHVGGGSSDISEAGGLCASTETVIHTEGI